MNNLATIYQNGNDGIEKDIHKAIELFQRSANLGNENAKRVPQLLNK